ncbi:MAG: type II toxin-antitoxin system Phd/YefM family antitoxin [Beijerinckiaceae bacterium]
MPSYSLAKAKDQLSKLVDEALAGEQVIITRHGKPAVELRRAGNEPADLRLSADEWVRLRARRDARPSLGGDSVAIVRSMRDERS